MRICRGPPATYPVVERARGLRWRLYNKGINRCRLSDNGLRRAGAMFLWASEILALAGD